MKLIIKKYMPIFISAMVLFLFAACLSLMMSSMTAVPTEQKPYCEVADEIDAHKDVQMNAPFLLTLIF